MNTYKITYLGMTQALIKAPTALEALEQWLAAHALNANRARRHAGVTLAARHPHKPH